jgi:SNF2 family DNA or RNA helicase
MITPSLFPEDSRIELHVTLDWSKERITFDWLPYRAAKKLAHGTVWVTGDLLRWRITGEGEPDNFECFIDPLPIEAAVRYVARRFPVAKRDVKVFGRRFSPTLHEWERERIAKIRDPWKFLALEVLRMGHELTSIQAKQSPPPVDFDFAPQALRLLEKKSRREEKRRLQQEVIQERIAEASKRNQKRKLEAPRAPKDRMPHPAISKAKAVSPMPEVRLEIAAAQIPSHDLFHTHSGIDSFFKIERASLMWISNQSDDLLCLPYCSIDHLEYQLRTALRVTGALRGRALLSDEVGLGKTIEAGLVLKEYVTRGLVRRFLVLTVPSLVDQWAEELESKFSLKSVTSISLNFGLILNESGPKSVPSLLLFTRSNRIAILP